MSPHARNENLGSPVTAATLHAVMFSDGEIHGDDPTGKFAEKASKGL
jgi:hypothetical protein